MSDGAPAPSERNTARAVGRLEDENRRLRAEVDSLRLSRDRRRLLERGSARIGTKVVLGPRLEASAREWLRVFLGSKTLPVDETADLLSATIRRLVRVGFVGLTVAALPIVILAYQTRLLRSQNAIIETQNSFFQEQNRALLAQLSLQRDGLLGDLMAEYAASRRALIVSELPNLDGGFRVQVGETAPASSVSISIDSLFLYDSAILEYGALHFIENIAAALIRHDEIIEAIEVRTHTVEYGTGSTDSGDSAANLRLASLRAQEMVGFLASVGVDPSKLTATALGASRLRLSPPVAPNEGLQRRTEVIVTLSDFSALSDDFRQFLEEASR